MTLKAIVSLMTNMFAHLSTPTAVTFSFVGKRRCEILGPPIGMKQRAGRWRRVYDAQGEESMLGWGEESFVDGADEDLLVGVENESI
jgi:SH3-like domain-containing protein